MYSRASLVGVHDFGPRCKRGALGVLISATRELLNNSDRRPLAALSYTAICSLWNLLNVYTSINVYYF